MNKLILIYREKKGQMFVFNNTEQI